MAVMAGAAESAGAAGTANLYREWARVEAHDSSPIYERLALAVAQDRAALEFLSGFEAAKRQPNLLFGAMRLHNVAVEDPDQALAWLRDHPDLARGVMLSRRTQTNEVARCAILLPALALLPQPLALIEVGASAGLCLLYDSWRYHYTGPGIDTGPGVDHWVGPASSPLTLTCITTGEAPLPQQVPTIVWRAGLDLSPIDATDPDARAWLRALIWPEHHERAERLSTALDVAAVAAPRIVAGDLVDALPGLIEEAPVDATVVVTHSATLAYLEQDQRNAFTSMLNASGVHRLGAEGPRVLPHLTARIPDGADMAGRFVVSLDDRALALAQPHGRNLTWL
jgi:hypothetical protein